MPIKDFIHHYPRALFNDIPRVGAYFYDIPGSGRSLTTYPGQRKKDKELNQLKGELVEYKEKTQESNEEAESIRY